MHFIHYVTYFEYYNEIFYFINFKLLNGMLENLILSSYEYM